MKDYDEIFAGRGSAYDRAMRLFPEARRQEFEQALQPLELQAGMRVADVPAGGGYLKRYLPDGCIWLGHEPCASFVQPDSNTGHSRPTDMPLLPLPWTDNSMDAAVSLAGLHHLHDKRPLFRELYRVTKPRGRLCISDVAHGSDVARFLDEFIGAHNSTGHEGVYLDETTLTDLMHSGWNVVHHGIQTFHWVFDSEWDMARFCHALFDLRTLSVEQTLNGIKSRLPVLSLPLEKIGLQWSLMTITARKAEQHSVQG